MIGLDGLSLGGCGQISVSRSCAVANPTAVPFIGDSVQSMPANHPRLARRVSDHVITAMPPAVSLSLPVDKCAHAQTSFCRSMVAGRYNVCTVSNRRLFWALSGRDAAVRTVFSTLTFYSEQ